MSVREPGSVLDGKYEIMQRLGSGGMGEVYLVRHLHLQELRVVKILRQDLAADPSAQKRFMREARLATQIKHPSVAILYDFSRLEDGSFYMVWCVPVLIPFQGVPLFLFFIGEISVFDAFPLKLERHGHRFRRNQEAIIDGVV